MRPHRHCATCGWSIGDGLTGHMHEGKMECYACGENRKNGFVEPGPNKDAEIETLKQGLGDAREKLSASFYASVVDWEVINKGHVLRSLCSPGETWHSLCLRAGERVVVLEQEQGAAVAKLTARVLDVLPTRYGCGAWSENVIIKKDEANRLIALIAELADSFDPKKYVLLRRESMAAADSWKRRALRAETGIRKAFRDVRGAADTLEEHRVVP